MTWPPDLDLGFVDVEAQDRSIGYKDRNTSQLNPRHGSAQRQFNVEFHCFELDTAGLVVGYSPSRRVGTATVLAAWSHSALLNVISVLDMQEHRQGLWACPSALAVSHCDYCVGLSASPPNGDRNEGR